MRDTISKLTGADPKSIRELQGVERLFARALNEKRNEQAEEGENVRYSKGDTDDTVQLGTLFSGAGTFESAINGLVHTQFAAENRPEIVAVYKDNHGGIVFDNVLTINTDDMPDVQVLHVSPPCVNLSAMNNDRGEKPIDIEPAKKGVQVITQKRPRAVTIENVPGYMNTEAMGRIRQALEEAGYQSFDVGTYKDSEYGGYTNRERVILRAMRDEELPPVRGYTETPKGWGEAVGMDYLYNLPDAKKTNPRMLDSLLTRSGIDVENIDQPLLVFGESYKNKEFGHAFFDEVSPTIIDESDASRVFMPDGSVKEATPELLAKIMGLDEFNLPKSKVTARRVIGNGIPAAITKNVMGPVIESIQADNAERISRGEAIRYSKSDSDGNELTAEQQEFFKDSKARDEEGRLKVLYHGSKGRIFTQFDTKYGSFFTDRLDVAQDYSGVGDVFSPTKPVDLDMMIGAYDDFGYDFEQRDGKLVFSDGYDTQEFGTSDEAYKYLVEELLGKDLNNEFNFSVYLNLTNPLEVQGNGREWNKLDDGNGGYTTTDAIAKNAKADGYDGVIFNDIIDGWAGPSNVYVAFDPFQIKDTENKNPTSSDDIRYSKSEDNNLAKTDDADYNGIEGEKYDKETVRSYHRWLSKYYPGGRLANSAETVARAARFSDKGRMHGGESQRAVRTEDSEGNRLSKNTIEETQYSSVRDEKGNLLVVYHASTGRGFTRFRFGDIGFHFGTYSQAEQRAILKPIKNGSLFKAYMEAVEETENQTERVDETRTGGMESVRTGVLKKGLLEDGRSPELGNLKRKTRTDGILQHPQ